MERKNCDESKEERARRNGSKDREQPLPHEVCGKIREQQLVKQRVAISRNDHILVFGEVFKTSVTSMNFYNVCFAILLALCCTWPTVPKALATPTNSNAHVLPVG